MHPTPPETQDRDPCRHLRGEAGGRPARGFTLVEIVVALAVVGVMASMAAPSFRDTIQNVRLVGETNRWARTLRFARSEAIKRAAPVVICARASDDACGTDWAAGWLVFVDDPSAGTGGELDAGETVIGRHEGAPEGIDRKVSGFVRPVGLQDRALVSFDTRGRPDWTAGTLVVCDARGADAARALVVGGAGDMRSVRPSGGAPVHDAFGNAVTCP